MNKTKKDKYIIKQIYDLIKMSKQPNVDFTSLLVASFMRGTTTGYDVAKKTMIAYIKNLN